MPSAAVRRRPHLPLQHLTSLAVCGPLESSMGIHRNTSDSPSLPLCGWPGTALHPEPSELRGIWGVRSLGCALYPHAALWLEVADEIHVAAV